MARKTETIKIDDQEYLVREMIVSELMDVAQALEQGLSLEGIRKMGTDILPRMAEGLTLEKALAMAPSDLKAIWDVFSRVNAPFFGAARAVGADVVLSTIKAQLLRSFWELSAGQSNADTPTP